MKDGQTFGQWLKCDFKTNGSLTIKHKNGYDVYREVSDGRWRKYKYDSDGDFVSYEDSNGFFQHHLIPEIIEHNGRKYQLIH
jgi:hypothetical protein